MAVNNFNRISSVYNRLGRVVFGGALIESQIFFLNEIGPKDRVLILGGGTGNFLNSISNHKRVDFIDKSENMIEKAKRWYPEVNYRCIDFLLWDHVESYDIVICPFFLDCFNEINLNYAISKIRSLCNANGHLIVTDFEKKYTGRILSGLMHFFFIVSANLESKRLKPIHKEVLANGFVLKEEIFYSAKRIFSRIYSFN